MADLPVIQLPLPEEEQPKTLYARITNVNEPPKFDDIRNSNLSREEKVRQIQYRTKAYQDDVDRELHKNYARIGLGGLVSAVGALPIAITKNPVIGSAIGGGVYELGQGIMEGDELPELMQRSGFGAAIGGAAGGVVSKAPQAAKFVNNLSGGKIGNALKPIGDKITNSKLYDALMTDVRAFDPNKQTAYHGSPYDFNKFSNEAIGTGEGAQAHGYGHYAALNKDVADKRYRQKLLDNTQSNYIIDDVLLDGNYPLVNHNFNPESVIKDAEYYGGTNKLLEKYKKDYAEAIEEQARIKSKYSENADPYRDFDDIDQMLYSNANILEKNLKSKIPFLDSIKDKKITQNEGQLYKLSVPKDDVMLREDLPFSEQPKKVQEALKKLANTYNDTFDSDIILQSINKNKTGKQIYKNLEFDLSPDWQAAGEELYNNGIKGISYNGGIDGEARVIFNPEDIEIVRRYYNQPGLFEQLTGKQNTGALIDSLYNK